ncbi:MAG: hypothetical protein LAP86_21370 [Acidobacteriia bacterium]|nr:hypothetical protein [Terriglobia bacterium]
MRPLRTGYGVAAVMIAAPGAAGYWLARIRLCRIVTVVCRLAATTRMGRRSFPLHRQRNKSSDKRHQQQKSGSKALHAVR